MAGEFSEADVKKAVDAVFRYAVQEKTPAAHPKAYILGGQPGAGKTSLQKELLRKCGYNAIIINGDEYRKLIPEHEQVARMPESRYAPITQKFANQVVEGMIEKAGNMSYNLIIEGTLRHKQTALHLQETPGKGLSDRIKRPGGEPGSIILQHKAAHGEAKGTWRGCKDDCNGQPQ